MKIIDTEAIYGFDGINKPVFLCEVARNDLGAAYTAIKGKRPNLALTAYSRMRPSNWKLTKVENIFN